MMFACYSSFIGAFVLIYKRLFIGLALHLHACFKEYIQDLNNDDN